MRASSETTKRRELSRNTDELGALGFWEKLLWEEGNGTLTVELVAYRYSLSGGSVINESTASQICDRIEKNTLSDGLLWMLSARSEGIKCLLSLSKEDPNRVLALLEKANLDAAPLSKYIFNFDQGKTVLWCLMASDMGRAFLLHLSEKYPDRVLALLEKANLNVMPLSKDNIDQGKTALLCLVANEMGRALLLRLSEAFPLRVLALLEKANLDAAPLSKHSFNFDQGKTVLWCLMASDMGRAFLLHLSEKYPDRVLALLKKTNLNTTPLPNYGIGRGKTALWWLVSSQAGRQILIRLPNLLLSYRVNLNTQFKLAESEKYLIEHLTESTTPEAKTLVSYCLLAGGSPKLLPESALRTSLIEKQAALIETVKRVALIMEASGYEEPQKATEQNKELKLLALPAELSFMLCLYVVSEHPELSRISPSFLCEVLRRVVVGEDQHHKNRRNAIISVCKGIGNKLRVHVEGGENTFLLFRAYHNFTASTEKALAKEVTHIVHDYLHKYCEARGGAFQLSHSLRKNIIDTVYEAVAPCFKKGKLQALELNVIKEAIQSVLPVLLTETASISTLG